MRLRRAPLRLGVAAAALVALPFVAAACSSSPSGSTAGTTTTTTTSHTTTTAGPAVAWSKPIAVAPGANLTTISCPSAGNCMTGAADGNTYRLQLYTVKALGPPVASPSPSGASYLSCATANFCAAAPSLNQVAFFNGSSWQPPATISAAQGFTAIDCTSTTFCITIDGEGNSFAYNGSRLVRQPRGLGRRQPDLLRVTHLLRRRRGRPHRVQRAAPGPSPPTADTRGPAELGVVRVDDVLHARR